MVRSLYWYLEERKKSFPKKAAEVYFHLVKIRSLDITVAKVRSIRNKWIVHRDKKAFENPNKYLEEVGLKLEDVKLLIETAHEIIQEHYPITELTNTGLNRLFRIVEFPDLFLEEIEKVKREIDAQEKFKSYN